MHVPCSLVSTHGRLKLTGQKRRACVYIRTVCIHVCEYIQYAYTYVCVCTYGMHTRVRVYICLTLYDPGVCVCT